MTEFQFGTWKVMEKINITVCAGKSTIRLIGLGITNKRKRKKWLKLDDGKLLRS